MGWHQGVVSLENSVFIMLDWNDYLQAIIAVFVITDPLGRPIFFAMLTKELTPSARRAAALKVVVTVALILGISAVVGQVLLEAMGINLGAFGFTGGLLVAIMGFEMTAGGAPTRVQGGAESRDAPGADDHLLVPFAMPFIAGPGAITTVITLSSQTGHTDAVAMSLVAIGVAILTLAFSLFFLTDFLAKIPERAMKVITRFGGLLIATIGVQLALNGIKVFFGL